MNPKNLLTALEIENLLGKKYFYRQTIYRLAEEEKLNPFIVENTLYFSPKDVENAIFKRLLRKIGRRIPQIIGNSLIIHFQREDKTLAIIGKNKQILTSISTESSTEEDFLKKIEENWREVNIMPDMPIDPEEHDGPPPSPPPNHGHGPKHHGHEDPHHGPKHGGPPPHEEVLETLRRIEDKLRKIEEKLD